jgi:hypothetical protein
VEFSYDEKEGDNLAIGGETFPYPINTGGAQLLPGRSRRCCFWVSSFVREGTRLIVDTSQLAGGPWTHNAARDVLPEDALLVIVHPRDAEHIRKALSTHRAPNPAATAARIIDEQCKEDPALALRMRWTVA